MKATIVDLRYKMNDVIKALDRNEEVTILYHGKVKGRIVPSSIKGKHIITDHPYFGMNVERGKPVSKILDDLRGSRVNDI